MKKMKVKKDDKVIVLAGKDKGKKGKVLVTFPREGKVIVERVNVVKKHQRPTREFQGGIIEKALPLSVSKIYHTAVKKVKYFFHLPINIIEIYFSRPAELPFSLIYYFST